MIRLITYLVSIALIATGLAWLADRPGVLNVQWQGYDIETSVFRAVVLLVAAIAVAIFLWSLLRAIWTSPATLGERMLKRRQKRGLDALSSGMIAVGAGDQVLATRYALLARKSLPNEPLTHLLRAQAAQLSGDRATARRIFEAMLASPDTEQLGLRGLYLEAEREGAGEAARQFAGRALSSNPQLGWSSDALFALQCKDKTWAAALQTLSVAKTNKHIARAEADRKRAVLLAALAQEGEELDAEKALTQALEAHALAPDLIPAAAIAGRILASKGNTGKAAKVIQKTWAKAPHPELAAVYAHARIGDSVRDRLERVRYLASLNPHSIESPIAVATHAIDARLYDEARKVLEPLLQTRLTQRVATLMARVEAGENGDKGRVREWLARAVNAARDPVWIADGVVSDHWEAISPVTGALDAFHWRVPVETLEKSGHDLVAERLEELLAISAPAASAEGVASIRKDTDSDLAERKRDAKPLVPDRAEAIDAETVTMREATPIPAAPTPQQPQPTQVTKAVPGRDLKDRSRTEPRPAALPAEISPMAADGDSRTTPAKPEAKIFVTPRAPDDPGPEEQGPPEEDSFPPRIYRAAKR